MHAHLFNTDAPVSSTVVVDGEGHGDGLGRAGKRVLVVDDEALIADTIVQILNRNGFQASAVYSGRAAVEAARDLQPETVLSDVAMPHLDGVETAIEIRAHCPTARIVLFSGQAATMEILERARALGHDFELLPKPIHPVELLKRLQVSS
ncbi:response regulator [Granulicella sp. 5B5]|uniref:response regulator n=1 Tax=Granulicella sp. 5B5 TaxID=1617967 RepID=UPI0015F37352|nr:response regulator [Granulicella sp. 5B5]QMV19315.1 response regulator [Granulicella sp. 5B5]